ncbi:pentapeptide repeat-containing protein [Sphaerothrix gracilis]|uniref:pentapeptide repeat-containing protein n=1 Tax=Sphaerothrix gracilis TaxID=3151835 RepID=UPI0031FBD858
MALVLSLSAIAINSYIGWRALQGDPRDIFVRNLSVWLGALGGTDFRHANLTDASFSEAVLKSARFQHSTLTRTCFHRSKKLHLARYGKTLLNNRQVLNLLVSLKGQGQSYVGLMLKGANLVGADLADANFTEADLSQATLAGATLERANLTKTQALGACFEQTMLTAACLESWNIDNTTQLNGAICDYVYLLNGQKERRPHSETEVFKPGEFTKLFQEVLDTIDLIFQNGIDWKAFAQTLQNVQVQHEGAELSIQSIENKGDGVVVMRLNSAPGIDKGGVQQAFMQGYRKALKKAERYYKAQLEAVKTQHASQIQTREQRITEYREQNANMQRVVELLAQRPITVDVKAESKAMQGNDQSQSIRVGGNFDINATNAVVNLRDISGQVTNQISQLPDSPNSHQPNLKELLNKLQAAIDADNELKPDEKAAALEQVKTLAEAGQAPSEGHMKQRAKQATTVLNWLAKSVSDASKLASACKELLPLITGLFA